MKETSVQSIMPRAVFKGRKWVSVRVRKLLLLITKSCPTICNPMDCSTLGFPVLHYLLESVQTHVHWVGNAIQPSHPLSPPSYALNLSQHQRFFQWVGFSHQSGSQSIGASALATLLPMNTQGWFPLGLTGLISLQFKGLSTVFSSTRIQKDQFFSTQPCLQSNSPICMWQLSHLHVTTLPSACDYWKNHSFDYKDLCQQSGVSAF